MEFLGSVGNKELGYMEQGKKELGLSDEVICFERQNEDWTNVLVNNDKFDYWEFFDYLRENTEYGHYKPTHYICSRCNNSNPIIDGVSYCSNRNVEYIIE